MADKPANPLSDEAAQEDITQTAERLELDRDELEDAIRSQILEAEAKRIYEKHLRKAKRHTSARMR